MIVGKSKEEQLINAIKERDTNRVTTLINKGANINYRKQDEQVSALDCAVIIGDVGLVNLLLDNRADVNSKTRNGYTALLIASVDWTSHPDITDTLIRHGADVNAKSFVEQWTPLLLASSNAPPDESVIKRLVEAGAQINDSNVFGMTPLIYVAELGSDGLVEYLLKNGADPRLTTKDDLSAIHMAAGSTGESYLHALENSMATSLKIIGAEATFYTEGMHGFADDFSENNRLVRPKVIRLLLEYGADIDAETTSRLTPLMTAIAAGNTEIAEVLIQRANINAGDETALMTAVWHNRIDIIKLLIGKKADVNHKKTTGENALEWAIFNGHDEVAKLLLNAGAKIDFSASFRKLISEREEIGLTLGRLGLTL